MSRSEVMSLHNIFINNLAEKSRIYEIFKYVSTIPVEICKNCRNMSHAEVNQMRSSARRLKSFKLSHKGLFVVTFVDVVYI